MISFNTFLIKNYFILILISFFTSKGTTHAVHDVRLPEDFQKSTDLNFNGSYVFVNCYSVFI